MRRDAGAYPGNGRIDAAVARGHRSAQEQANERSLLESGRDPRRHLASCDSRCLRIHPRARTRCRYVRGWPAGRRCRDYQGQRLYGVMKRHGFHGCERHMACSAHRSPARSAARPRAFYMRMAGRMGSDRQTTQTGQGGHRERPVALRRPWPWGWSCSRHDGRKGSHEGGHA